MTDEPPGPRDDGTRTQEEHIRQLRNVLAVVRSIVRRTGERSDEAGLYSARVISRINAYSYAATEVMRRSSVDLAMLVADQLMVYGSREGDRLAIGGDAVCLKGKVAESIALAIHELACNAMEHGALTSDRGKIAVSWTVEESNERTVLELIWNETELAVPPALGERGFGMNHLLRSLPYETGGHAEYRVEPSGLHWKLSVPLQD